MSSVALVGLWVSDTAHMIHIKLIRGIEILFLCGVQLTKMAANWLRTHNEVWLEKNAPHM